MKNKVNKELTILTLLDKLVKDINKGASKEELAYKYNWELQLLGLDIIRNK
jgi:hypothetical protein